MAVEPDPRRVGIVSVMDMTQDAFSMTYFFEASLDDLPAPPQEPSALWRWAHENGGVDAGWTTVVVTVQVVDDIAVVVDAPRVRCLSVTAAPCGTHVTPEGVGGGPLEPRLFEYEATVVGNAAMLRYEDERAPSFTLGKNESERLVIRVHVPSGKCQWQCTLPIVVDGRRVEYPLRTKTSPFVTVAGPDSELYLWSGDRWLKGPGGLADPPVEADME